MSNLRVIGVPINENTNTMACVYKENKLYIYDYDCNLNYLKEYIDNIEELILKSKTNNFELTDFAINLGDQITRGNIDYYKKFREDNNVIFEEEELNEEIKRIKLEIMDEETALAKIEDLLIINSIYVNGKYTKQFKPLKPKDKMSSYSLERLFYKILKILHKRDHEVLKLIEEDYKSKEFQKQINTILLRNHSSPVLDELNKELIIRARTGGIYFIINKIKTEFKKYENDPDFLKLCIYNLFSRLFVLEQYNYIDLDALSTE